MKDLAESELTQRMEHEKRRQRRLSIMEVDPVSFLQDIAHAKQRSGQLEEQLAKEDTSVQTSGEHHTIGGRFQ